MQNVKHTCFYRLRLQVHSLDAHISNFSKNKHWWSGNLAPQNNIVFAETEKTQCQFHKKSSETLLTINI